MSQFTSMMVGKSSVLSPDVVFEKAFRALPHALAQALRQAGLDDPATLQSYPRFPLEEIHVCETRILSDATAPASSTPVPIVSRVSVSSVSPSGVVWSSDVERFLVPGNSVVDDMVVFPCTPRALTDLDAELTASQLLAGQELDGPPRSPSSSSSVPLLPAKVDEHVAVTARYRKKKPLTIQARHSNTTQTVSLVPALSVTAVGTATHPCSPVVEHTEVSVTENETTASALRETSVAKTPRFSERFTPSYDPVLSDACMPKTPTFTSHVPVQAQRSDVRMSDPVQLYRTLVQEGLVPSGYSDAFDNFYKVVDTAAQRTYRKLSKIDNVSSAVSLHNAQKQQNESLRSITSASVFQPIPPAAPLLFKSRLDRARCTGPTARSDAEAVERGRWIDSLEKMLRFSPTPMGRLLSTVPGSKDLLGGGRRLSTLRNRVRGIRKFLTFVSSTFGVDFPLRLSITPLSYR